MKLQIIIYFPTLGQAKDEVDGWLEKGSLASGWPSSSVRRTNATVHTRHHMAVKVNNFSKNSNILYLDWWEVRGCSKCCLPAWWPNAHPPLLLMSRSSHSRERNFLQFSQESSDLFTDKGLFCYIHQLSKSSSDLKDLLFQFSNENDLSISNFFAMIDTPIMVICMKCFYSFSVSHIILRSKRKLGMDIVVRKSPNV